MQLFTNYQSPTGTYYCDITPSTNYLDPIARLICFGGVGNGGYYGCPDMVLNYGFWSCNDQQLWNCNLCGNDMPFWVPFTDNDTFDFQFQQLIYSTECLHSFYPNNLIDNVHTTCVSYEILTCCDGEKIELDEAMNEAIIEEAYIGEYMINSYDNSVVNYHPIQMARFNLEAIKNILIALDKEPCFYIVFRFSKNPGDACLPTSDVFELTTEPFKFHNCDKFPYIYNIESNYSYKDCFGTYYGLNYTEGQGIPFAYSNRVRVPGAFEQLGFNITKEKIQTSLKTTSTQVCENWVLKTTHLPKSFAKFVANVLAGRDVLIDGVEYQVEGELSRNNDTGNQFYLEIPAQNCNCNKSLSCE